MRNGLLKKVYDLSLLCDAEHERTLGRYNRCSFNHQDNPTEIEPQSWCSEVSKLKAKYESLEQTQRHCLGEDLAPLSIKELQSREKQLEGALAQARQRKLEVNEQRALPSNPSSPCSPLQIYASNSMQIQIQSFMQIGHHHYNLGEGASDPRRMAADINMFQGLTL